MSWHEQLMSNGDSHQVVEGEVNNHQTNGEVNGEVNRVRVERLEVFNK